MRIEQQEETEWWCPTGEKWSWCPGPCPDGSEHAKSRTYMADVRVMDAEEFREYRRIMREYAAAAATRMMTQVADSNLSA